MHDHQQNGEAKPLLQGMRQNLNFLVGAAQCACKPLQALLRRPGTWGQRHMNFQAIIGYLFCALFPSFYRDQAFKAEYSPMPMFYLLCGITIMLIVHRTAGVWRRSRGYECSSGYSGLSVFSGNETRAKTVLEPVIVLLYGIALVGYNVPLGVYLVVCGIALGISAGYLKAADDACIRQAKDAKFQAMWLQERMGE